MAHALRELIRMELAHERVSADDRARAADLQRRLDEARARYSELVGVV
ncbi:hypothetical protein [uncultured Jatrophihabitans sp.]